MGYRGSQSTCSYVSRFTSALVTSTPHLSQTTPLYLIFLYFPQWHSQSLVGPKIRSQNSPSFSGLRVRYYTSGFLTSPRDHSLIFSGEARPILIFSNDTPSFTSLLFLSGIDRTPFCYFLRPCHQHPDTCSRLD